MALTKRPVVKRTKGAGGFDSGILIGNDVWIFSVTGALTDGTSGDGAGWAGPGSQAIRTDNGAPYKNTGTKASPTWTAV